MPAMNSSRGNRPSQGTVTGEAPGHRREQREHLEGRVGHQQLYVRPEPDAAGPLKGAVRARW
jgi:hypothetical protein